MSQMYPVRTHIFHLRTILTLSSYLPVWLSAWLFLSGFAAKLLPDFTWPLLAMCLALALR